MWIICLIIVRTVGKEPTGRIQNIQYKMTGSKAIVTDTNIFRFLGNKHVSVSPTPSRLTLAPLPSRVKSPRQKPPGSPNNTFPKKKNKPPNRDFTVQYKEISSIQF